MSSLFSRYQEELDELLPRLGGLLDEEGEADVFSASVCDSLVEEAEENLEGMDMEVRRADSPELKQKLALARSSLKALKAKLQLKKSSLAGSAQSRRLLGEEESYADASDFGDGQQMVQETTRLMQKGSERVHEALREAAEMEELGIAIAGDLAEQRGAIEGMGARLDGVDADVERAQGLMAEIRRRLVMNKVILGIGVGSLVLATGLVGLNWLHVI